MINIAVYKQNKYLDFIDPILREIEHEYGIFSFNYAEEYGKPEEITNGTGIFADFPINPITDSVYLFFKSTDTNINGSGICGQGACVSIMREEDPNELNLFEQEIDKYIIISILKEKIRNRIIHELLHTQCLDADGMERNYKEFNSVLVQPIFLLTKNLFRDYWEYKYYKYLRDTFLI